MSTKGKCTHKQQEVKKKGKWHIQRCLLCRTDLWKWTDRSKDVMVMRGLEDLQEGRISPAEEDYRPYTID